MIGDSWLLAIAGVALLLAAVAAAAETAVTRLSGSAVEELRRQGVRGTRSLALMVEDRARYVNPLLLMSSLLVLLAAALVLVVFTDWWPLGWALAAAVLGMGFLNYLFVGVAARTLGRQHPAAIARALGGPIRGLAALLSPISSLLILLGNAFTPGKGFAEGPFATQAELREFVDQAEAADLIEDDERQMIHSVFQLGDTIAREVMVPRTEMVYIEQTKTLRQAMSLCLRSGFSRVPVIGENADDVVGVVYLKDITRRVYDNREAETSERVASVMRPAYFVPDSKNADDLLRQMQADRVHLAIIIDEFGGTAGMVTIEDILEEIVGEIADEYDTGAPEVDPLPGGGWRVSARMSVEHFADLVGIDLDGEEEGVETVGGLLALRLGKVPIPGARVDEQGIELIAESAAGRRHRIGTVLCRPLAAEPAVETREDRSAEPNHR